MFPESGSGSVQIEPIYPRKRQPIPLHLRPVAEANTKYQLASALNTVGECYCEVTLNGRDQIDLVWVDTGTDTDDPRIVGIEVKTASEFDRATHKLESQVEEYRAKTVDNLTDATAVAGDVVIPADEVYVFDEVWAIAVGDHDPWNPPGDAETCLDGWLNYNPVTGLVEYDIDVSPDRPTIQFDYEQRVGEAQITAFVWDWYQSSQTLLAAETWYSKPRDRLLEDGRLKYRTGKGQGGLTKHADLVVSELSEINPLRKNSTIQGIEVKASFGARTRNRLDEQLPLYCESQLFSEVYLAIPEDDHQEAKNFLESNYPQVGLLAVNMETQDISLERPPEQLELRKVPVGWPSGSDADFQL